MIRKGGEEQMKYEQPIIVLQARALDSIQGSKTKGRHFVDSSDTIATSNAYEADE
jgi:hypothetical protein